MPQGYWPDSPRMERFSGSTNGSGTFSGTFAEPFQAAPAIMLQRGVPADPAVTLRVTAVSTTGFTIIAESRESLAVLGVNLLSFAVSPSASQPVVVVALG